MRTKFIPVKPEELEYTMTITMKLKDWQTFSSEIQHKWPGSMIARDVSDMHAQAHKNFWSKEPEEGS